MLQKCWRNVAEMFEIVERVFEGCANAVFPRLWLNIINVLCRHIPNVFMEFRWDPLKK